MSTDQFRLPLRHAVDAVSMNGFWTRQGGWQVNTCFRHACENWKMAKQDSYWDMSTDELLTLVGDVFEHGVQSNCQCDKQHGHNDPNKSE